MDIIAEKRQKRLWAKKQRMALRPEEKKAGDMAICKRVLELPAYQRAEVFFCFIGTDEEIDTRMLLEQAWKDGKRVTVPKCMEKGCMEAYEIRSFSELSVGKFGILEPEEGCPLVRPGEIDFAVIPCVSCDREGRRLGRGGGYYDRYLEKTDFVTAVLCREKLLLEKVPAEGFDSCADWVITEDKTIWASNDGCPAGDD